MLAVPAFPSLPFFLFISSFLPSMCPLVSSLSLRTRKEKGKRHAVVPAQPHVTRRILAATACGVTGTFLRRGKRPSDAARWSGELYSRSN